MTAIVAQDAVEQITDEVDLLGPILQQSILLNEFDREYAPLASIQAGVPIEFLVKGADQLYLDLNDSLFTVRAKMTMANGTNVAAHLVGPINLALHSMFCEVTADMNENQSPSRKLFTDTAHILRRY